MNREEVLLKLNNIPDLSTEDKLGIFQWYIDNHPVSIHGIPTALKFTAIVKTAKDLTLLDYSIKRIKEKLNEQSQ